MQILIFFTFYTLGFESQFDKANADDVQDLGFGYDFDSVMHYNAYVW